MSTEIFRDDTKTIDNTINDFPVGTTTQTLVLTNFSNAGYVKLVTLLNTMLGYTLPTVGDSHRYRFVMETRRLISNEVVQEIKVYNNSLSVLGAHIFTLSRIGNNDTNSWSSWVLSTQTIAGQGHPNGVVAGMRGWLYQDVLTGKLYTKTVHTDAPYNTNWIVVGA